MRNFFNLPISKGLFALAIIIRLLIIPFFFHPDIKTYYFQASFFQKGVVNIYPYLIAHRNELPLREEFVYYPLTYLFLGSYEAIVTPIVGGGLVSWLWDASQQAFANPNLYRYLLTLKLPYLALDLVIPFLIASFFVSSEDKKKAFIYWLFNPLTIIVIYVFSNVDIIPVTLTLLCYLLLFKKKDYLSAIVLALAVGFKAYPGIFLPFILLGLKDVKRMLIYFGTFIVTLLAIILPFWSKDFLDSSFASGLTTRLFATAFTQGRNYISLGLLAALGLFELVSKKKHDLLSVSFVVLAILFAMISYHMQWLLWFAPFAVILIVKNSKLFWPVLIFSFISMINPVLLQDKFMSVALLNPISIYFGQISAPYFLVQKIISPEILIKLLHLGMLVLGGVIGVFSLEENK